VNVTYVTGEVKDVPSGANSSRADCPAGQSVLGGGYAESADSTGLVAVESRPNDLALGQTNGDSDSVRDDGWVARMVNGSGSAQTITAYAICAPVTSTTGG